MDDFIKILDKNLEYISHRIEGNTCYIEVKSNRDTAVCPYCGMISAKVHSMYDRSFQDLPISGKKVIIILHNKKLFCNNPGCAHKTFAERFDFINNNGKTTKRLKDEIIRISLYNSSVASSEIIRGSIANVGKSTICSLLKKKRSKN